MILMSLPGWMGPHGNWREIPVRHVELLQALVVDRDLLVCHADVDDDDSCFHA